MEVLDLGAVFCALGGNGIMGFVNVGAEFCALGGNGIVGSDDWAARDKGCSLSSLFAYLSADWADRDEG